jgi:TonB family protein
VSVALSLVVHATLLVLATVASLPGGTRRDLIRVWLMPGDRGGAASSTGSDDRAAAAPAPPQQLAQTKPPSAPQAHARHVRSHARSQPLTDAPPSLRDATAAVSVAMDDHANGAGAGAGVGAAGSSVTGAASAGGSGAGDGSDQRAYCVSCPEPHYPLVARARGWQGIVDVGLLVLADGSVDAASLRRSSGYGVLDAAAIAVARQSRFSPPAANGLPTPLHGRIEYRFELTAVR